MVKKKPSKDEYVENIIKQKCGECGGRLEVVESTNGKTKFNIICKKCNTTMLLKDFLNGV